MLRQTPDKNGYLTVGLHEEKRARTMKVHRLVAMSFLPNPNSLPLVGHIDHNPANNCVGNLEWCTQRHNMHHAIKAGRWRPDSQKGKRSGRAKFSDDEVRQLRRERATELAPIKELAAKYGVCDRTIISAIHGKHYGDVK